MSVKLILSTAVTGGMTLLSRVFGLARDNVLARVIGAGTGVEADAFYVAFRIPNFFRRIFGEGAFSQAFVPVLSEYREKKPEDEVRGFLDNIAGFLLLSLIVVVGLGMLTAPWIIRLLAPGFLEQGDKFELAYNGLRIMFPYLLFISLVAMAGGIFNTWGRFGVPAFTPVLLNVCMIAAALWLSPYMENPVLALSWGVFVAGVVQLAFQIPFLIKLKRLPLPRFSRSPDPGVKRVLKLMAPAMIGVSVAQINLMVNTILASFLATGSVAWLYYSDRVMEFPLGIFGIALGTVILPSLSRQHANASEQEFSQLLDWGMRLVLLIVAPATVGLILLSEPIVSTLFQYGAFNAHDVKMSAAALVAYCLGLPALLAIKILAPGFYARQNTKTPVKIAAIAMLVNVAFAVLLFKPLAHVGLAMALSISAFVNAGLLFYYLSRYGHYHPESGWLAFTAKVLVATAAMATVLIWGAGDSNPWLNGSTWERVWRLSLWIGAAAAVYVAVILASGIRPRQLLYKHEI